VNFFLGTQSIPTRIVRFVVACVSTFLLFQFVSLYLSYPKQIVVGAISVVVAMVLNRTTKSQVVTLSLMLISLAATLRYGWWRVHMIVNFFSDESNNRFTIDSVLMLILLSAEAYTILIMVLGFMQTSSPLRRKPIPLPSDESLWPDIDVLIPTYNEPLSLVRYTALAAVNIDYPPRKLHVYILDDGTRDDFREFAKEAGIGYIVRQKHDHAKAGNINNALKQMNSPLVTIFDCDHVPTRSFLQVTVGWFLAEKKLAMLQTPHYFYSPDPFERNLLQYKTIPNEGELFYGIIQDGNDLWNATFFCGSCAVIRRSALNEVGGIATETVTEDAHTSLRMQKNGWNTAYINLPQAAGLATETLSAHVGQRVRWARGMIQIFRTDNPMLARGMKFTQRVCYFNAMLHFLYAVPRLIFLLAPLIYMLAGRTIIPGYWVAILAYALPHLVISSITNSRVQGNHRHSFWNEIYETVLAPYILLPTLLALINPKLGKFNVTDKGNTLAETKFDRHIAAPTTWLLALNLAGVLVAPYRFLVTDPTHPGTVISNLLWILFNMVILGVAAAVANEQQQRRNSVRIPARVPVQLFPASGVVVAGITEDMSVGGASLTCSDPSSFRKSEVIRLAFPVQTGDAQITATVVAIKGNQLSLQFEALDIEEQETLTCAIYSRADSWINTRNNIEADRPLISLGRVIHLSFTGFHQVLRGLLPRKKTTAAAARAVTTASATAAAILAMALTARGISAQIPGANVPQPPLVAQTQTEPETLPESTTLPATASVARPSTVTLLVPATAPVLASAANEKITLKDMGVQSAVDMHGPHSFYSVGFVLAHGRLPRLATLNLSYHFSAALLSHTGMLTVSVNKTPIAQIAAPSHSQQDREYGFAALPVPAELLVRNNEITFEFTGGTVLALAAQTKQAVLGSIGANSTLFVEGDPVPFKSDLSLLPLPLFDADLQTTTTIAFVFLASPTPQTLQAAGVVASWFGMLASSKPVRFTVSIGEIPHGNAVIFANDARLLPAFLQIPSGGASLSIKTNPSDPDGSVLVLSGDGDGELLNVARALSLMTIAHPKEGEFVPRIGDSVRIADFALPEPRKIDDAPRWLPTDKVTSLWSLSSKNALKSDGTQPLPVYLRVPPDLHYGENQNLNLKLSYRYNSLPAAAGSSLRVFVNGALINEAPLPPGSGYADRQRTVLLPVADMRPFGNTLLFNFDFVPANPNPGAPNSADKLRGAILEDSYLDIRGLDRWAALPNLELFANAGFPFTRHADLADTTIIVPLAPSAKEIALFLSLLSHWGTQTGYPALRIEVAGPDAVMSGDRDYLILGNAGDQPAFAPLESALPVTFDANGIHVKQTFRYLDTLKAYWQKLRGGASEEDVPANADGMPELMIEGIESPFFHGRSVVVMSLRNDDAVDDFADVFFERSQSSDIAQTVSLLRNGKFSSYAMDTSIYHVGDIATYPLMRLWFVEHFYILLLVVLVLSLVLARYARDYLALLTTARLQVDPQPTT
jgi:cellulose synthase (UDP-forming)